MTLCNDADIKRDSDGRWRLIGEPTEGAVLVFGRKVGINHFGWNRVVEIPFDSATKYMATISEDPDGDRWIYVKGALDAVLPRCTTQIGPDGRTLEPIDPEYWEVQMEWLASQGLRILAAAQHDIEDHIVSFDELEQAPNGGPTGLTMVGLCGIVDPPRPEAIQAIAEARNAGIAVSMITGDHVDTAKAIALEMGLVDSPDAPTLTGKQLEQMSDAELADVVRNVHVYARTSPEHKIRIVRALQSHGEVVAMTGDGVNDAPALTQADVGVAMGIKGTEATKEAANIVLADDNFATIERAIAEGRRIYDNIRKAIMFMLPTNGAQGLVLLAAIIFGWAALPMRPVQVLWINMVTSVTLSLPLAMEPAEDGVMSRAPRDPKQPLLSGKFLTRVLIVSLLLGLATIAVFQWALQIAGLSLAQAQSAAVTMLALGQVAYLFSCRFLDRSSITTKVFYNNPILWYMIGALVVLQLVFLYAPFMHPVFQSAAIGWRVWLMCASLALLLFLGIECIKLFDRLRNPPVLAEAVRR
ncbi:MAG: HAD-IC family P-type ATPase [Cellulomonadaceae bacterium]|nr:HAD-IC family P-type ATPase [Cellulomonadaceae bacterium]